MLKTEDVKMSCKCDTINIVNDNNVIVVSHADGRDGKSAYQQAVEGGYTGTEQEFNCSLSLLADVAEGKKQIADAINERGGNANYNSAFTQLAQDIEDIPNFPTTGIEYISEIYRPRTLMEAYNSRSYLKSIVYDFIEEISGSYMCADCTSLRSVELSNLIRISGHNTFDRCTSLQNVQMPNLFTVSGSQTFTNCTSLKNIEFPNLINIIGNSMFYNTSNLQSVQFGTLVQCVDPFTTSVKNLRNITIGQDTDISLPFQYWYATNVINEGQSGIDELNANLYNNLLSKLYDHSTDGQTRTLRLGWLAKVSQENIDYANSKGWTLTT
jgi:hypothetical protein